ncbi:O-methyltransferase [Nesterenkonia muleiensis]|uniref:O-methyltransferase n=1 Tax=Nesterenkonia muleiensis TaxID=2282648 RepID=UPI000E745152|nr:O-methyltransferase [Nesterenkonia muleiensis]
MSTAEQWAQVDRYFIDKLVQEDQVLEATRESSGDTLFPGIDVAPNMGAFLSLLVQITGARRILEIGTLAGYSAIWMARAAGAEADVVTCELEETNAAVARANFERAGVADRVRIMLGAAADSVQSMIDQGAERFDLVFIDADKRSNPTYLDAAVQLSRPGTVIVIDNTVRGGKVIDETSEDPDIIGTRRLIDMIAEQPGLTATALQTVGMKGWDGFTLVRVG